MGSLRRHLLVGLTLIWLTTLACSSNEKIDLTSTPATATATSTPIAATATDAATAATLIETESPPAGPSNAEAALAAVTSFIKQVNTARCPNSASSCLMTLDLTKSGSDFDHGLGVFTVKDPPRADAIIVFAETLYSRWELYVWGNPSYHVPPTYQATSLPGEVTICAFGQDAIVRAGASPADSQVATIPTGTSVTADQFVLTQSNSLANAGVNVQGYGWYHVADPAGWVYSKYVAAGPGCELHDILERQ